jgi:hypothetical protein
MFDSRGRDSELLLRLLGGDLRVVVVVLMVRG